MQKQNIAIDPQEQIRRVYLAVLEKQERFDALKQGLASYPAQNVEGGAESPEAAAARSDLNRRIDGWVDFPFAGLSAVQVTQLRQMMVDERINVALSPWKESNGY